MAEHAIWDDNGEWVELTDEQEARLLRENKIYLCPGDTPELPACHIDDVYHVSTDFTLQQIKAELNGGISGDRSV